MKIWSMPLVVVSLIAFASPSGAQPAPPQMSIPAGAAGSISPSANNGSAGGLIGFKYWQEDQFYCSLFGSYTTAQTIHGNQSSFGAFILNPPNNGSELYTEDYYLFPLFGPLLGGPAVRLGLTLAYWQADLAGSPTTIPGLVFFLDVGGQFTIKRIQVAGNNSVSLGLEADFAFRYLGGDLGAPSADSFLSSPSVLGTTRRDFEGIELTLFGIVNSLKLYGRLSWFFTPTYINGLSDLQGFIGAEIQTSLVQLQ